MEVQNKTEFSPGERSRLTKAEKLHILFLSDLELLNITEFAQVRNISTSAVWRFLAKNKKAINTKHRRMLTDGERSDLLSLFDSGYFNVQTVMREWKVSRSTIYKLLKQNNLKREKREKRVKPPKTPKPPIGGYLLNAKRKALVEAAREGELSVPMLATKYGISRQAIYALLKRRKVTAAKKRKVELLCPTCQTRFSTTLSRSHQKFCSKTCTDIWQIALPKLNSSKYRLGQRIARSKLEQYIQLEEGWIIWHADRDWLNNDIGNLMIFDTFQNLLYHLLWGAVEPIFNGKDVE